MFAPEELFQPTQSNICKSTLKMSGSVYLKANIKNVRVYKENFNRK